MSDEEDVLVSYADLPEAVVHLLFRRLYLPDLVSAACACSAWHRFLSAVWRGRCLTRWHHWASPPPAQDDDAAAWRGAYIRRHKVDAAVLELLMTNAAWPTRKAATFDAILAHGADAVDVLTAAAQASSLSGLFIGLAHQAHMALLVVQGQLAGQHIQALLAAEAGMQGASGPGPAAAGSSVPATPSTGQREQPDPTLPAETSPDYVLEVALHLAQSLHPLSDMSAVRDIVARLGDELGRRMQHAGAQPGSREALTLLNNLLFGDAAASEAPASDPTQAQQQDIATALEGASSSGGQAACSSGCWPSLWPRNAELHGSELSTFTIPSDGRSGLGFKGSPDAYTHAAGSCMDSVLAQRSGLPITLAILHRAVGKRVGLDVQLVNMPGHVINRVVLSNSSAGSSSGSGAGGLAGQEAHEVYVDAYAGSERSQQDVLEQLAQAWAFLGTATGFINDPAMLPNMSAGDVCRRMLANLCNLYSQRTSVDAAMGSYAWVATSMALAAPLGQLCPVSGVPNTIRPFRLTGRQLLSEALALALPPGRHMSDLIAQRVLDVANNCKEGTLEVPTSSQGSGSSSLSQVEAAQYKVLSDEAIKCMPSGPPAYCSPEFVDTPDCQLGAGEYPIGTPVQVHATVPGSHGMTGLVAWRTQPVNQNMAVCYNILRQPDGHHVSHTFEVEALSPEASTAGHTPPWASDSCLDTINQAQQLLRRSCFEAGFRDQLTSFLKSSGQWLEAPESWGPVLQHLISCSKGLGYGFEAVMYDAAGQQCFLVPNAFVRYMFPKG